MGFSVLDGQSDPFSTRCHREKRRVVSITFFLDLFTALGSSVLNVGNHFVLISPKTMAVGMPLAGTDKPRGGYLGARWGPPLSLRGVSSCALSWFPRERQHQCIYQRWCKIHHSECQHSSKRCCQYKPLAKEGHSESEAGFGDTRISLTGKAAIVLDFKTKARKVRMPDFTAWRGMASLN
jgi:hypothetical protein